MSSIRSIAIYLPQFHPIPENDAWWGKGFTEWTNVAKATPLFPGQYQPHLPADLGFYDLRLEETRLAQEALAKQYGIYGFCYYHYWFNGKRLLHEPLDRKLQNPKEDLPFMLCWANENWTRRWDGFDNEILIKQNYSKEDDIEHIHFLCKQYFSNPGYIRVNGKPFFTFYRVNLFPDIKQTIKIWREEARKLGIGELYIGYMTSFNQTYDLAEFDLDVAVEFAPHFHPPKQKYGSPWRELVQQTTNYKREFLRRAGIKKLILLNDQWEENNRKRSKSPFQKNTVFDYADLVEKRMRHKIAERTYPSLYPMWDNTARKKGNNSLISINNTPALYKKWLVSIIQKFKPFSEEENFIFINAWNEWAEGNHLEPCQKWGLQYLEATRDALTEEEPNI